MWTINDFIINIASIGPSEVTGPKPNIGIIVGSIIGSIVIVTVLIAGTCLLLLMCCLLYNILLVLTVIGIVYVSHRKNKNMKVDCKEKGINPSSKL